jgi:hypothetical protein
MEYIAILAFGWVCAVAAAVMHYRDRSHHASQWRHYPPPEPAHPYERKP